MLTATPRRPLLLRAALGILAFSPFLPACDPPCPTYWQAACEACGPESPGCKHAREAASRELGDPARCTDQSANFTRLSEHAHRRYCETWMNDPRSLDDLRGPWICNGIQIDFTGPATESRDTALPQRILVDDKPTRIHNLRTASFQVEGKPACEYHLGPHEMSVGEPALTLRCPEPLHTLPGGRMWLCLKK